MPHDPACVHHSAVTELHSPGTRPVPHDPACVHHSAVTEPHPAESKPERQVDDSAAPAVRETFCYFSRGMAPPRPPSLHLPPFPPLSAPLLPHCCAHCQKGCEAGLQPRALASRRGPAPGSGQTATAASGAPAAAAAARGGPWSPQWQLLLPPSSPTHSPAPMPRCRRRTEQR